MLTHLKSHKIFKKFKSRCSKTILVLSSMQRCFIRLYSLFISEWNSPVLKSSFENFWIKIFIYSLYPLSVFEIFLCTVFLRYIKLRDFYLLYHPQGINLVMYILWIKCYCFYWLILFFDLKFNTYTDNYFTMSSAMSKHFLSWNENVMQNPYKSLLRFGYVNSSIWTLSKNLISNLALMYSERLVCSAWIQDTELWIQSFVRPEQKRQNAM